MATIDGLDMSYVVSRCDNCGFHFAPNLPSPDTYSQYYRRLSKYDLPATAPSCLEQQRATHTLNICRPFLTRNAVIADIGCGNGALLAHFHHSGFSALHGLDPAPQAATAQGIAKIHQGGIQDAPSNLPLSDLDLLCLTGVLEHLPNLRMDMAALLGKLPPTAKILVEVPALEQFRSQDSEPFGEFSLEHIQYFSRISLANFMSSLGYSELAFDRTPLDGASDSLFALFGRGSGQALKADDSAPQMESYIKKSTVAWNAALAKIAKTIQSDFFIYGAGSHTARLIPQLHRLDPQLKIRGIVDSNLNLQSKYLAEYPIASPDQLNRHPDCPILISSYRTQEVIAKGLKDSGIPNQVIRMY